MVRVKDTSSRCLWFVEFTILPTLNQIFNFVLSLRSAVDLSINLFGQCFCNKVKVLELKICISSGTFNT